MKVGQFLFQDLLRPRIFFDPAIDTLYVPTMEQHSPAASTEEDSYIAKCNKAVLVQLERARIFASMQETWNRIPMGKEAIHIYSHN
jgi:hypothetical protein